MPVVTAGLDVETDPRWWREEAPGDHARDGRHLEVLRRRRLLEVLVNTTDDSQIPTTGPIDRILASHFEPGQGADVSHECGLNGASNPSSCSPEYLGRLQPYQMQARGPDQFYKGLGEADVFEVWADVASHYPSMRRSWTLASCDVSLQGVQDIRGDATAWPHRGVSRTSW